MMRASGIPRAPWLFVTAAAAAAALFSVGVPAATTGAFLTAGDSATAGTGIGDWCSVPNPAVAKNVYPLSDFTVIQAPESTTVTTAPKTTVRMLVVPVVNDGSFDPVEPLPAHVGGVDNQLGVRLWSCTPTMSSSQSIKLTAWRGDYSATAASAFAWDVAPGATVPFAQARLHAGAVLATNGATTTTTKPGDELRDVHRGINKLGGVAAGGTDPVTMRYSWMLSTGRSSGATSTSDPSCVSADCHVDGASGVTDFNSVFSGNDVAPASNAVFENSTTYFAEKYYGNSGAWPTSATTLQCSYAPGNSENWSAWEDAGGTSCQPRPNQRSRSRLVLKAAAVPSPTVIAPTADMSVDSLLRDTTGTKIQYVVLEWWGAGAPPADLEVEVFVK